MHDVAPSGRLINSGPVNQGQSATVSFSELADPSDVDVLQPTYEYDFGDGNGFVWGGVSATVPETLGAGSHVIKGRVHDGTDDSVESTTTFVINDLPPQLSIYPAEPRLIEVNENKPATLSGSFSNVESFNSTIGDVTHAGGT